MINNKLILSFAVSVLSMVGYTAKANPVDIRKATDIARQYMRQPVAVPTPGSSTISTRSVAEAPAYHLFVSKEEQRFVIVSGESQMNEVVGYGKLSTGDANALPPQVHALLQQYTETVRQVRSGEQPAATSLPKSLKRYVTPLVTAQWGQSYPYNSKTPRIGGKPTYTGCVATAAAQFLYFYKWPKQRPALYVRKAGDGDEADTSPTYLWDAMKDTREQMKDFRSVNAVGRLLVDVGKAIRITFGTQASPSNIEYTLDALQNDFGYTTRLLHRDRMQADEFREAIMQELSDGYPVMVCGGIHAFIYDGYDRRGFIHANFGWDGQGDGYYDINTITTPLPGPFMGNGQFWENQVALMAHPKNGQYPDFPTPQRTLGARKNAAFELTPRSGQLDTRFSAMISGGSYHAINGEFGRYSGQVGIAVKDANDKTVKLIDSGSRNELWSSIFTTLNIPIGDINFSDLPQGNYLLVPIARELVAKNPDRYKEWYPIQYANRMNLSITSSGITVTDEIQGGELSICRAPEMLFPAYHNVGEPAMITLGVRNPSVDEVHGILKMIFEPVNGGKRYVAPFNPNNIVSFRRLADTQVAMNFPTNYADNTGSHAMSPGHYKVKFVLETTNTPDKRHIELGADQNYQIEVLPYPDMKIFVRNVDFLVKGNEVNQQVFDIDKQKEITMRIHTEVKGWRASYRGKIYYRLVCPETNESIEAGTSNYVTLNSSQHNEPQLTAAKIDLTRLTPKRHYEIHIEIDENGKRREIWTNDSPRAQIMVVNGKSNSTPDNPTKPVVPPTPEQPSQPETPKATQVVLDATQREVKVDDLFTLVANVLPKEADPKVTWHLSQPGILDMVGNGQFKALKAGEVTITATAQDGSGMKATCRVVVKNPMATQVVLNKTQHNAIVDDVFTLTAKVMPEKAAQNVVWTMDKTNILQDLGNGKFKALKAGEVTITATAQDGSGMKATCRVVVKNPMATQVVLNKTQHNAIVDDVFTLTAKVMPEKAAQNVVWTMDKTNILQNMGDGKFKALKAGEVILTATAQDGSGVKATCRVVVKNPMATQVVLNKTQHNATVDDVFTLTAQVMPEKAAQNVVWTMDKTNILQDLGNGKFKALKAGEVTITATAQDGSGMKATCRVVVKNPMATQVVLNKTQHNAIVDDVFTLTAKVMPEKAAQNVVWTMDKTNILQDLGNGKFKALKAGEVTITATAQDGSGMKATCRVVVKNPMATQVVLNKTQHNAIVDDVFTLTAKVMPEKAAQNVVWTMDKTNILQDLGNGKFKALKAGEVTITATAQDGSGMKATCRVVVKNPIATQVVLNASNKFVYVEEVFTLNANILPEKAVQKVSWELSNATIVESLGDGRFLALREGRTTITAVATDGSGVRAVCHVVVQAKKPVVPEIPKATEVVLDSLQRTVHAEEEFTLIAKVMPEQAVQKVVWTMDKTDILQDLGEGKFKALKTGEVMITATAQDGSGVKATCHVTVIPPTTLDFKKTDVRHSLHWEGATLVLRGAKPGSIVRVYSMKGKKLHLLVTTDSEVRIDFGLWHGVYLLETNDGFRRKVVR